MRGRSWRPSTARAPATGSSSTCTTRREWAGSAWRSAAGSRNGRLSTATSSHSWIGCARTFPLAGRRRRSPSSVPSSRAGRGASGRHRCGSRPFPSRDWARDRLQPERMSSPSGIELDVVVGLAAAVRRALVRGLVVHPLPRIVGATSATQAGLDDAETRADGEVDAGRPCALVRGLRPRDRLLILRVLPARRLRASVPRRHWQSAAYAWKRHAIRIALSRDACRWPTAPEQRLDTCFQAGETGLNA